MGLLKKDCKKSTNKKWNPTLLYDDTCGFEMNKPIVIGMRAIVKRKYKKCIVTDVTIVY